LLIASLVSGVMMNVLALISSQAEVQQWTNQKTFPSRRYSNILIKLV
jgi:hypothetical protein